MKFLIYRVGRDIGDEEQPLDMAVRGTYTYHDFRTTDDPTKIGFYYGDPERARREWYGTGTNHRVVNGMIARSFPGRECWFIDITSPEQLVALARKYGTIKISCELSSDEPQITMDEGDE